MDILTVHTIKIFMLYVGIIAALQEHACDHCRGRVSGHVYIYPNPLGQILNSFGLLNMSLVSDQRERETLKVV
jgi:hypothetical protein